METGFAAQFNEGVRRRAKEMLGLSKQYMVNMGVEETRNLFKRINLKMYYAFNEVEGFAISMPQYGFVQMSEGGIGSKVSLVGNKRKYSGGRPRPFLFDAVDEKINPLSDWVAHFMADRAIDHSKEISVSQRR